MNNITKYLYIFLIVVLSIIAVYYYFQADKAKDKQLELIEQREEMRLHIIDSLENNSNTRQLKIDSLTDSIKKLQEYEPIPVDNSDLPDATNRELDSILSSYYNR